MAKQRVLVTGGAGFLGSHLCDRFIKEGFHVIAMDNLITGDLRNIEHLFKHPDFEFYHHDVSTFVHIPGELHYILARDSQSVRSCKSEEGKDLGCINVRSLWRPVDTSSDRRILW